LPIRSPVHQVSGTDGGGQIIDEQDQRFVLELDGGVAELVYRVNGNRLVLIHTEVPDELRGRGIAGRLVRAALARAADEGLTVVPLCPYATEWLIDHPEESATVTIDWGKTPS
jgi:hypothetical protein